MKRTCIQAQTKFRPARTRSAPRCHAVWHGFEKCRSPFNCRCDMCLYSEGQAQSVFLLNVHYWEDKHKLKSQDKYQKKSRSLPSSQAPWSAAGCFELNEWRPGFSPNRVAAAAQRQSQAQSQKRLFYSGDSSSNSNPLLRTIAFGPYGECQMSMDVVGLV